ncbi:uncharacterized protein LOC117170356 [Belonocnema kinseyi]|uniref:uncharacterized protein LOC117170356 n=1 Tax=Belonocnema kinseyi TaxID=2817044 RepID=UPI00143D3A17|nr:uncharacterized protein LOC117170356 [Belonocnema kinseyi]
MYTKCCEVDRSPTVNEDGTVDVELIQVDVSSGIEVTSDGVAIFNEYESKYITQYEDIDGTKEHLIVYTDYINVAIQLNCHDEAVDGLNNVFILARQPYLEAEYFDDVWQFLSDSQLGGVPMVMEDWESCQSKIC